MEVPEEISTIEEVDGIFASANLGYKDFLFLDVTARRDQSSSTRPRITTLLLPVRINGLPVLQTGNKCALVISTVK